MTEALLKSVKFTVYCHKGWWSLSITGLTTGKHNSKSKKNIDPNRKLKQFPIGLLVGEKKLRGEPKTAESRLHNEMQLAGTLIHAWLPASEIHREDGSLMPACVWRRVGVWVTMWWKYKEQSSQNAGETKCKLFFFCTRPLILLKC